MKRGILEGLETTNPDSPFMGVNHIRWESEPTPGVPFYFRLGDRLCRTSPVRAVEPDVHMITIRTMNSVYNLYPTQGEA